jgi:hypothetical protein
MNFGSLRQELSTILLTLGQHFLSTQPQTREQRFTRGNTDVPTLTGRKISA